MNSKPTRTTGRRRAFTLVEAIVVIIILGILATAIAPRVIKRIGQSRASVAKSGVAVLSTAMYSFIADHGQPEQGSTIDILWEKPDGIDDWDPYVNSPNDLLDPWGNKYILLVPPQRADRLDFDIVSYGADGKPGGEGEDEDIYP